MNISVQYLTCCFRRILPAAVSLLIILTLLPGCAADDKSSPSRGESVTGTFLEPVQDFSGNEAGFVALDEECGHTDDPLYMNRFVTSMFRDGVTVGELLYLVDGRFLWTLDVSRSNHPVRMSLLPLPGEAVSVTSDNDATLWVAAGSAGIIEIDIQTPDAPIVTHEHPVAGNVLDVAYDNRLLHAAAGHGGVYLFDTSSGEAPLVELANVQTSGFPNGVAVSDDVLYVSACGAVHIIDTSVPHDPMVLARYLIPTGHAKDVHAQSNMLFVSAGEMLVAVDVSVPEAAVIKGYYSDVGAEGFYVNGAEVFNDTVFIAAGDESVRAVSTASLSMTAGEPAQSLLDEDEPPVIDGPFEFEEPVNVSMSTVQITHGDPINVVRDNDTLFVLGNFRWAGQRLVRIFRIDSAGKLIALGEYAQPEDVSYLDATAGLILMQQGHRTVRISDSSDANTSDDATGWPDTTLDFPAPLADAAIGRDRIRLLSSSGYLYEVTADGEFSPMYNSMPVTAIEFLSTGAFVETNAASNCISLKMDDGGTHNVICDADRFWGHARLASFGSILAAYNPLTGELLRYDHQENKLSAVRYVGVCENYQIDDFYSSANESEAVLALNADNIYLLCPSDIDENATVLRFDNNDAFALRSTVSLPPAMYRDIALLDDENYVLCTDNNHYSFSIARVTAGTAQTIHSQIGYATTLAIDSGDILVGDNNGGIRRFHLLPGGRLEETLFVATSEEVLP